MQFLNAIKILLQSLWKTQIIIYIKVLLDCDCFISVQLIPNNSSFFCNHNAKICHHSAKICNHSEPVKLELKRHIASNQIKHGGRALPYVEIVLGWKIWLFSFFLKGKKLSQTSLTKVTYLGEWFFEPLYHCS